MILLLDLGDGAEELHACAAGKLTPRRDGPPPGTGGRPRSVLQVRVPITPEIRVAAAAAGQQLDEWAAAAITAASTVIS